MGGLLLLLSPVEQIFCLWSLYFLLLQGVLPGNGEADLPRRRLAIGMMAFGFGGRGAGSWQWVGFSGRRGGIGTFSK